GTTRIGDLALPDQPAEVIGRVTRFRRRLLEVEHLVRGLLERPFELLRGRFPQLGGPVVDGEAPDLLGSLSPRAGEFRYGHRPFVPHLWSQSSQASHRRYARSAPAGTGG